MNIIGLVLGIIISGGIQLGDDPTAHSPRGDGQMCITAEKLVRPTMGWKVLKTEIKRQNNLPYLEVSFHNPMNKKTPDSVDAKFILSIDPAAPSDPQRYSLVAAFYYNATSNVSFKRIYSAHDVTINNKVTKFPVQTPCFAREVLQIMKFEPVEVQVK